MPLPGNAPKYNLIFGATQSTTQQLNESALDTTNIPDIKDMEHRMAPVFDQGQLGSCTGNAFVGALEYLENKKHNFTYGTSDFIGLSRLFVYYNERLLEGTLTQDAGAQIHDGIKALSSYGVCKEDLFPYDITQYRNKPSDAAYAEAKSRIITNFANVSINENSFITALANSLPIVFGIMIYESFESDEVARTGLVPMPTPTEQCLGGHAVLVSGYNRTTRLLKVRNSWGADWGDNGYFYLPFDYVFTANLAADAWVISDMTN
jgi:C1A family cysteine protease